jgi:hypothetical protein
MNHDSNVKPNPYTVTARTEREAFNTRPEGAREAEINEQKIGQAVFGRSENYDSAVDGIIRNQASRLRQRLELYFQQEGAGEPIRVVIPRGGYVPVFEAQAEPAATIPEVVPPAPAQNNDGHRAKSVFQGWLPWGLCLLLSLMLVAVWLHGRQVPGTVVAQTHPFWSLLFTRGKPTMVVAPDSGLVLFHGMSGQDIDLKQYLDAGYRSEPSIWPHIGPTSSRKDSLLDLANRRYTSIVDLKAILGLKDRAQSLGSDVSVRYARDLRPNDFKTGTAIPLGAREANPWDELFHPNMNFQMEDDYDHVFDTEPPSTEGGAGPVGFLRDDLQRRVYGLVAYMPNLPGDGSALLLEGTGMSGAEAGMDFVLDDAQLLPFLNRIRRPEGTVPHFELLLESQNIGGECGS